VPSQSTTSSPLGGTWLFCGFRKIRCSSDKFIHAYTYACGYSDGTNAPRPDQYLEVGSATATMMRRPPERSPVRSGFAGTYFADGIRGEVNEGFDLFGSGNREEIS
jgi:hypothetical protein